MTEKEINIAKTYDPKDFEERIYERWEKSGAFKAERDPDKTPYTIVMPPPNITGQLHMGHALDQTLQDILTRWKRMQGFSALWIPGSDHASIATEVKVVEKIREEEGKEKEEIGREEFLKRAWEWKKVYGGKITRQCRKLGDSCDWSRERFTMDEGCNKAVNEFFVHLYNKGLIYRGNRLINWCPECGTSISDAEVEHENKKGAYWYFRYPSKDGGKDMVVATSRPETMFGDVAIAVHPSDERYKEMVGKKVLLPIVNREIPIIADTYPDPEKGTGAVKITPAHDFSDFEVGERHGLERLSCIDEDARMNSLAGKYEGMDRYECRKVWVADLEKGGYLVKTEEIEIPIGGCYRCSTAVEPMLSDQWFVAMEELAKPAIRAAKDGELIHVPERFEKTYLNWLENIRDWCVSRQLWWGHRIPAWYCEDCGEINVAVNKPERCKKCGSKRMHQDEDVLDTWFSSALWPLSTLGWPDDTKDLRYFYPTSTMVTGYDIIFFWVVRMVFSAMEITGEVPFKHVFIHGLVRDHDGRKMSKSLGNGIDPLEVINEFGADALRFMLATGITPGNDMRFQEERLQMARNFANKLWNASRFVIMNIKDEEGKFLPAVPIVAENERLLQPEDKWIISTTNETIKKVTETMEKFDLGQAGQKVYEAIWNQYCDWYIEIAKGRLYGSDDEEKKVVRGVLLFILKDMLKILHPFMPFITEEIWGALPGNEDTNEDPSKFLMKTLWPSYENKELYPEETKKLEMAMEIIRAVRNIRAEVEVPPSKKLSLVILSYGTAMETARSGERYIKKLANITNISFIEDKEDIPEDSMSSVTGGAEIFIPSDDLIDYDEETARLTKEKNRLKSEVQRVEKKLADPGFVSKAPKEVISKEKEKLTKYVSMLDKVCERLVYAESKKKK